MNQNRVSNWSKLLQPRLAHFTPTLSSSPAPGHSVDTLHYTNYVAGEAVQFNRSVSAMPVTNSKVKSTLPLAGTADYTLLLR